MGERGAEHRERVRATLARAQADQRCVAVGTGEDEVSGWCVGVGERWALLRVAAPWPDGWVALRLAQVDAVEDAPEARLARAAFEHEGAWPPAGIEGLGLDETSDVVVGLAERHPLLGVSVRDDEGARAVGRAAMVAEGTLMLQDLGPDLTWGALSPWRLRDLAELSVDDRYLRLLADLAPERPHQATPFA